MSDASQEPGFVAACLIWVIRVVALLISLAVWAVVGFLYWIPMLVFAIVRFSALVVYTPLARTDPSSLGSQLDRAVGFYVQGFSNLFVAWSGKRPGYEGDDPEIQWKVVILSTLGALVFWVVAAVVYGVGSGRI